MRLAESLSPITKKLDEVNKSTQEYFSPITKKLDAINESTQKVGDIIIESNSENIKEIVSSPSILLQNTFKYLVDLPNSLKSKNRRRRQFKLSWCTFNISWW